MRLVRNICADGIIDLIRPGLAAGNRFDLVNSARLLYVAMTRAMKRLILTHHGDSRFVGELSKAIVA